MSNETDFHLKRLAPLVGGTITALVRTGAPTEPEDDEFYGIQVTMKNGDRHTLLFLRDPEGNGPGSFEIAKD